MRIPRVLQEFAVGVAVICGILCFLSAGLWLRSVYPNVFGPLVVGVFLVSVAIYLGRIVLD